MENNLFVGSISFDTTEEGLKAAFEQAGEVTSAKIISDRDTGRSRGFGFVEMVSEEAAQAAIEMYDGKELDGREISVQIARAKDE